MGKAAKYMGYKRLREKQNLAVAEMSLLQALHARTKDKASVCMLGM